MRENRAWATYAPTYRAEEVKILAGWIMTGESGSVVGLRGSGKSNLLGFLSQRPEVLWSHLPENTLKVALVQVDLNNLPGGDLATFYRVILRSLSEARAQLAAHDPSLAAGDGSLAVAAETLYRKVEEKTDPFLSQSALREALLLFQEGGVRLVLMLDPFDHFCRTAEPQVLDNLRGLRDSFKTTLSYIVGVRHELAYLRDPLEIGEIYELLDTHLCWVGAMVEADARWVIDQVARATGRRFTEVEIEWLLDLTGSYPSLLKSASLWFVGARPAPERDAWLAALLAERSLQYRLEEIWTGLTQEEQLVLSELQKRQSQSAAGAVGEKDGDVLTRLEEMGPCVRAGRDWRIRSDLLTAYVANVEGRGLGKIWLDEKTEQLYQGQTPLVDLTPLERSVLTFLVQYPRIRHTKTDLIISTWPDELRQQGVTDQSLYQVILDLRKKIEPDRTTPRYLITWRGKPEGGYQFYPEGQPG